MELTLRTYVKRRKLSPFSARGLRPLVAGVAAVVAVVLLEAVASPVGVVSAQAASAGAGAVTQAASGLETYARPDVPSALAAATESGREVLVTSETTATSLTYARPGGSLRNEVSAVPVRVKQADGSWADVDYDLVELSSGGYAPKVSPADVVFSGGGAGPAVTLDQGTRGLDLSWAKTLPAPTVKGSTARYDLGGGQTLVLSATSDGFEQSLELATRPVTAPKLHLGFDPTGVELQDNESGGFDFVKTDASGDATSTVVFTMPAPMMYSAQVVEEEHTQMARVPVTLGKDDDGSPSLDLSAGMSFLTDPATVYPVTIDPVISSVSRAGDTYITQADAAQHVSDPDLRIGLSSVGNLRRSLIRFDAASTIPAGAHIMDAGLDLWNNATPTCDERSVYAYPLTKSVVLTTATWATQPTYTTSTDYRGEGSFSHGNESLGCANDTGNLNLTRMVQAWVSGTLPDYGLALVAGSETDASYAKNFCSMNVDPTAATSCTTSDRYPTLSVTYGPSDADVNSSLDALAKSFAGAVTNETFRSTIHDAVAAQFDGDNEVLWSALTAKPGIRSTLAETMAKDKVITTADAQTTVDRLASKIPHFQVAVSENFDAWNPADYTPLVAYMPEGVEDTILKTVTAYDAAGKAFQLDAQVAPKQPVIVLGLNERTDDSGNVLTTQRSTPDPSDPTDSSDSELSATARSRYSADMISVGLIHDHEPWTKGKAEIRLRAQTAGCSGVNFTEPNWFGLDHDNDTWDTRDTPDGYGHLGKTTCDVITFWWEDDGGGFDFTLSYGGYNLGVKMDDSDDQLGGYEIDYSSFKGSTSEFKPWTSIQQTWQ
jgi:DUF3103 family protein